MLKAIADSLLSLVYPQDCRLCNSSVEKHADGVVCSACWDLTKIFSEDDSLCGKCGAFLTEDTGRAGACCRNCREHLYDVARSVGVYEKALAASVLHLKREPIVSRRLTSLFVACVNDREFEAATLVVPVPLSRQRQHERGFNQAAILAEIAARAKQLRLDTRSLSRKFHTPMHRAAMDRVARERTVSGAFEVIRPKLIAGERVLLVDDVLTSGSTASQCAAALKNNGAEWVGLATIARAT